MLQLVSATVFMKKIIWKLLVTGFAFGFIVPGFQFKAHAQNAPVTTAATVTNAVAGQQVVMPVTVTGFANIGAVTLTLDYDYTKLHFVSASVNPGLAGNISIGDNNLGDGNHRLVLSWFGNSSFLPDGNNLVIYTFTYLSGTATLHWFENGPSCEYADANAVVLDDSPASTYYIDGLVFGSTDKQLQLSFFLEGLYNTGSHKMDFARNAVGNQFPGTTVDQVSVELHDAADYSNIVFTSNHVNLDEDGTASLTVPGLYNGAYYITIKHRNSVETVSAMPVSFGAGNISYAFDDASKAFGSNIKQTVDGSWVFFCGDVNQDGVIDAADLISIDNDAALSESGYKAADTNGDGLVNTVDLLLPGINAGNFVEKITP